MKNHQNINADSGSDEYYTPPAIIEAVRRVMGEIDLDPASSVEANKRVKAVQFFAIADDGLNKNWFGHTWMNHPFGRLTNRLWIAKLASEYASGRVTEAICITFAATSEKWFQPLMKQPQCYLSPRTNYFLPSGKLKKGVTKGSVLTYFGHNLDKFSTEFKEFGTIKITLAC